MNLNHDVHTSPKEESFINGSIQDFKDFTDCIDFTKQYQKSCFGNNDAETFYQSSPINSDKDKYFSDVETDNKPVKEVNNAPPKELENGNLAMEPDVSITIQESNLEKTINNVAKGDGEEKKVNGGEHVDIVKKKRVVNKKRNHVKVPVNRNIKKKTVLKFRNGRYMQRKNNQYQNHLTNVKFRCYKCSNSEFPSLTELVNHQRKCLSGPQENPLIPDSSPAPQTNVKTPRKVYLCSACGNYYENWNLFIHMIEMHKRHICLFCLGMFSNPEKLSQHLQTKHNVVEQNLSTTEDFLKLYKGTCYLICCSCEKMFSDERFDEHSCTGGAGEAETSGACPLCGLIGAHFPTCRRAFSDRCVNVGGYKSHPALGKKLATKRKKKPKEVFRIVNNDNNEMSVTVRKHTEEVKSEPDVNADTEMISPSTAEQYNEKMLQLYKKPVERVEKVEKVTSSLQSIEDSINRVVESSVIQEEEEEEEDTNLGEMKADESKPEEEVKAEDNLISDKVEPSGAGLSDNESTDSEKLTIALEKDEPENLCDKEENQIQTAGSEIPYIHVTLKDEKDVKALIKEFVKESCWNCVYCAHAKRIAVNGKQLALHLIAEHRYATVPPESADDAKADSASSVVALLKDNLADLENSYFNTDTFDSEDKSFWKANDRIYECFHCLFATYVHKELYSHNKKMHQKTVFLCIMCKSNFYNYSELLCHLCPGIYIPGVVINPDITYRCFLCNADPLPSSFRLMVHLRRRHNSCDICFDVSGNQSQLSTHVWKHKLSHYCYRCGIAYRNKPDITKHLFWKHGTESVMCKRCLQKKWPHVYHFCVPPASFACDECPASLKSAVALKVHKRLHVGDSPYSCTECEEKFISKKLLEKHSMKHEEERNPPPVEPEPEPEPEPEVEPPPPPDEKKEPEEPNPEESVKPEKEKKKKKKPLTDVFDLPPVNLSESDDSDDEEPRDPVPKPFPLPEVPLPNGYLNPPPCEEEKEEPTQIVDGIWNNFQNYLVSKDPTRSRIGSPFRNMTLDRMKEIMLADHDYHIIPSNNTTGAAANNVTTTNTAATQDLNSSKSDAEKSAEDKEKIGLDHDYCNNNSKKKNKRRKDREGSKSSSSDSSSDSDTSCSCGSNCSCTSGSSSSSSSNESDSDEKDKRKEKKKKVSKEVQIENEAEPEPQTEVDISVNDIDLPVENPIRDSDLETSETETDEDFYDYNPAKIANRILAEKRLQLLANLNGSDVPVSAPSTPTPPTEKTPVQKKKTKMKKRRAQPRTKRPSTGGGGSKAPRRKPPAPPAAATFNHVIQPVYQNQYNGYGTPMTPVSSYEAPPSVHSFARLQEEEAAGNSPDSDAKRPKRKRVPLKFYGFSSDEEGGGGGGAEKAPRKREKVEHNTTTPAPLAASTPTIPHIIPPKESTPTIWNPHSKNSLSWRVEKSDISTPQPKVNPIKIRTSQAMRQNSFYTSAPSETFQIRRPERHFQINGNSGTGQRGEKLYCFCQCPYDEVSEMIACDAKDCVIEWFHFECVGIMVPPQGSWYCPDCRKKLAAENEFMPIPIGEQNLI